MQAKISLYVSCASALGMLMLTFMLMHNYKPDMQSIVYGPRSLFGLYAPLIYLLTAATILLAGTGAAMGAVSAGQQRNTFNKRSWTAFFVGGISISATIVLFYLFLTCKLAI